MLTYAVYIFTVLWYTVLSRTVDLYTSHFDLFWSFKEWFSGNTGLGWEILANVIMFVPFGFLTCCLFRTGKCAGRRRAVMITVCLGMAASLIIETLQLIYLLGVFELDDILTNAAGTLAGACFYNLFARLKQSRILIPGGCCLILLACVSVIGLKSTAEDTNSDKMACLLFFQPDSATLTDGKLELKGFAFRDGKIPRKPVLILRSTNTGKKIRLSVSETERPDAGSYFGIEIHGFKAEGRVSPEEEYEILIRWPWTVALQTGTYITGENIHYYPSEGLIEPTGKDLDDIVQKGVLRLYRPDYHCWVYQSGVDLCWVVGPDFVFEDDGGTYIQYQLWTTETSKLPQERLENNWLWDNIGGYFEEYEIEGDFGPYRVMKREIPAEYPVMTIETGYYKNGAWVWKHYFRPLLIG